MTLPFTSAQHCATYARRLANRTGTAHLVIKTANPERPRAVISQPAAMQMGISTDHPAVELVAQPPLVAALEAI